MEPTVIQQILNHAATRPEAKALTLIELSGKETTLHFDALVRSAQRRAHALRKRGISKKDLVLLLTDDLADLIQLFLGAMMVGALPAILPFPVTGAKHVAYEHLRERIIQTKALLLITSPAMLATIESTCKLNEVELLTVSDVEFDGVDDIANLEIDLHDTAFVQFSSGTTGAPKGLMVNQRSLFQQINNYARAIALDQSDVSVSWSPLYHDQGLVSNLLMPLSQGIHTVLMSPSTWLKKPVIFFEAVDRHRCTISRWPNFAFIYTAKRVTDQQMQGISLDSLRMIANAGEPITADAWPLFKRRFEAFGLKDGVMNGSFGMAENCLCVSLGPLEEPLRQEILSLSALNDERVARVVSKGGKGTQTFVSCGKALEGTDICILDEKGDICSDRIIGEIALRGDCLLDQYYSDGPFPQNSYSNGYYRTGDMGYLADGWLTVTGRKKDIVIVGGKNINPEHLERLTANIKAIRAGRVIALGIPDKNLGTEQLIIVCELHSDDNQTRQQVRQHLQELVQQDFSVWLSKVIFRERGWIEKTTSGKLSRFRSREKLLAESEYTKS